ncbi:unnamed protein product [Rhizophagus irregularis]|nr:unnamed protein product [Rhizophagus irregularis]CAB5312388.1 unnamed protein product [Rhizophagus irregularis]
MSGVEQNNSTPENTKRVPSPLPPSQQSQIEKEQEPAAEKSEKEISKPPTHKPGSLTANNEKQKLHLSTRDHVVQISNDSTVGDDESIWDEGDQPTSYNMTRKLSSVEEDVCYPLRTANKGDGIDYDALEEYITEEKTSAKKDDGNYHLLPSPIDGESKRRISEFGERKRSISDVKEESRFVFYSIATGTIKAKSFATIPPEGKTMAELLKQGIFWLDVLAPTETEMRILSSIFRIHPLTMEDIETEESREKCELFKNYYFVSFRSHDNNFNTPDIEPINMYNVVMREGILTFHFQPTPHQHNVRKRIQYLKDFITLTPDWINYAIMDDVTDYFAPLIQKVEFESDAIDQLVMVLKKSEQQDMLVRIGLCRKLVMTLLKMLGTKVDVIKGLIKRFEDKLLVNESDKCGPGDVTLYLGDIQDHIITMLQNLNHYENMLSRAHSNYLAQISIEITQLSNTTNDFLNRMTVFATILLPMNVITGLFGMNVHVPGQDDNHLAWFLGIVGSFGIILIIGTFFARKLVMKMDQ